MNDLADLAQDSTLREIFVRAETLDERVDRMRGTFATDKTAGNSETVRQRVEAWKRAAAGDDGEAFRRRLSWDEIEDESLPSIFRSSTDDSGVPAPSWTRFLPALLGREEVGETAIDAGAKFRAAFPEIYEPLVTEAQQKLVEKAPHLALLSEEAVAKLAGDLLVECARLGETVVYQEFGAFRVLHVASGHSNREECYQAFIESFDAEQRAFFFTEYAALARLLCLAAKTWVETTAEMVERMAEDFTALERLFSPAVPLGLVAMVSPPLSDRHHGGRRVRSLSFTSGVRVVYKPKKVALERSFHEALRWLAEQGLPCAAPSLRLLDRGEYGWVEFAAQQSVEYATQVRNYYRKAGALLAVVHALDGNDCHMENVIATSLGPVLIDGEAILQPSLSAERPEKTSETFAMAREQLRKSVLRTGLLPQWQRGATGAIHDVSGLGGRGGYPSASKERFWRQINTDGMVPEHREKVACDCENVLRLRDEPQSPGDFVGEIVEGFETAYRFIVTHRDAFFAGPVAAMKRLESRLILRPSSTYGLLLAKSLEPEALRSGVDRSLALEPLCRVFVRALRRPSRWPLVRQERLALDELDIPFFAASTDSRDIALDDGTVLSDLLSESSHDYVSQRIRLMNEEDLRQQTDWIRTSFHERKPPAESAPKLNTLQIDQWLTTVPRVANEDLVAAARKIAADLAEHAVRGEDRLATWITTATTQPGANAGEGAPYYLYDGTSGIVLFLAAFQHVTGSTEYRDLIRAACRPMVEISKHPQVAQWLSRESIGAACGLGSVVYALTAVSQFIGDPELLEAAGKIARCISDELIAADQRYDLLEGSAGAIVSLLALHGVTGEADLLERAVACGRHLLGSAVQDESGGWAWPAFPDGALLGGLAHGAAGIAYALSRLYAATQAEEFLEGARRALQFERTLFDPAAGNWPIMPPAKARSVGARPISAVAWCHGAPGVGLCRLGSLGAMVDDAFLPEIETALDTTIRSGLAQVDHLCCGNFGRIELALVAAQRLGQSRFEQVARAGAALALQRAQRQGRFTLQNNPEQEARFQPGFFRGTSGIGYTLLRLAFPGKLPSVLLWEPIKKSAGVSEAANRSMNPPTTSTTGPGITIRKVGKNEALGLEKLTFPAYRPLLHRDPANTVGVAVAAFSGDTPLGLALCGVRGEEAELLSLFVSSEHRGHGLGGQLLAALERELKAAGAKRVVTTFMTGKPGAEAFQRTLEVQGWEPPVTRMLVVHSTSELSKKAPWRRHSALPAGYELLLWEDVTPQEREEIRRSQESNHWIPKDLVPFNHEKNCDLRTSVALRKDGKIVGWLITHLLWGDTVRFTCNFVREDLQRRGRLFWLYGESCRRAEAVGIFKGQGTAPLIHPAMAAFAKRWMEPYASFFGETRGSQKLLS